MYIEYSENKFNNLIFDSKTEPELVKFINDIKTGTTKFNDYPTEELDYFAEKIYELRKNNINNAS